MIADNLGLLHGREGFTARSAATSSESTSRPARSASTRRWRRKGERDGDHFAGSHRHPGPRQSHAGGGPSAGGAGHRVLMLCGALFEQRIREAGAEFVPFAPEVDFDYRALERHFPERASLSGTAQMALALKRFFAAPWRGTTAICGR